MRSERALGFFWFACMCVFDVLDDGVDKEPGTI